MKINMKKVLMLLAISAMALPAITAASIDTNLKYGARGTEVSELQEFLIDKGFLSGAATGSFYSLTLKAVIAYQRSVGLPVTGFVGPMTRNSINQELAGDTSTQAEVTETGTTTPPLAESPIDLLKKQIALLMQQVQILQGQATTQNQQAQQTQQQLGQIVTNTTPPPTTSSAESTPSLSLSLGQITPTLDSAYVTWSTSIPADSKIFVTPTSGSANSTRVLQSSAGRSTQGFINITGLTAGIQYSYEIEAIAGSQVKKFNGSFLTTPAPKGTLEVKFSKLKAAVGKDKVRVEIYALNNDGKQVSFKVTNNYPDLPKEFTLKGSEFPVFNVASNPSGGLSYLNKGTTDPATDKVQHKGDFTFTFEAAEIGLSKTITLTVE